MMDYVSWNDDRMIAAVIQDDNGSNGVFVMDQLFTSIQLVESTYNYENIRKTSVFGLNDEIIAVSNKTNQIQIVNMSGKFIQNIDLTEKIPYREGKIGGGSIAYESDYLIMMTDRKGSRVRGDNNDMIYKINIETGEIFEKKEYELKGWKVHVDADSDTIRVLESSYTTEEGGFIVYTKYVVEEWISSNEDLSSMGLINIISVFTVLYVAKNKINSRKLR